MSSSSSLGRKERKPDKRRKYSSATFSRTNRSEDILEKANSLVQTIRSKHANTDEILASEEKQESNDYRQGQEKTKSIGQEVAKLRGELAMNLKLGIKQNKNVRSMDSVFGEDHESLWMKDFRKFQKPRLSISITSESKVGQIDNKIGSHTSKDNTPDVKTGMAIGEWKSTGNNPNNLMGLMAHAGETESKVSHYGDNDVDDDDFSNEKDDVYDVFSEVSSAERSLYEVSLQGESLASLTSHSLSSRTGSRHSSLFAARTAAHRESAPSILPPIDKLTESRYFGKTAKSQFYATYQELLRQSDHLLHGTDDIISCLQRETTSEQSIASIAELHRIDKTFKSNGQGFRLAARRKVNEDAGDSDGSLESWEDFDNEQSDDELPARSKRAGLVSQTSSITDTFVTPPKISQTGFGNSSKNLLADAMRRNSTVKSSSSQVTSPSPAQLSSTVTLPIIYAGRLKRSLSNAHSMSNVESTDISAVSTSGPSKPKPKPKLVRRNFSRGSGNSVHSDFLSAFSKNTVIAADTIVATSSSYRPASPRAKFLAGCIKLGIIPRTKIMLRPEYSHVLDLEHQSMGDKMGKLLADGLNAMPNITVINLADNNLTDVSLKPLLDAISVNPHIVELDLSENKLDEEASEALGAYLANPNCQLRCLRMRHADVDDGECHAMVEKIMNNHSLLELDLSRNLLGKDENLNAIKPEITTAGEALAILLRLGNCALRNLKISWNMIRMEGASDLCESVAFCHLTHLDMSFNALSNDAGIELGVALHHNKRLKELIVSDNGMGPAACVCICVGIRECKSLEKVCLDGNTLGEQGARALISIPMERTDDIMVTTTGCNLTLKEERCWLNFSEPEGEYRMNMELGYDRAAFFEILRALTSDPVYQLTTCEFSEDGKTWERKRLVRFLEKGFHMSESERKMLEELKHVKQVTESDVGRIELFNRYKEEGTRGLTKAGFCELTQFLKCKFNARSAHALFDIYDIDKSGYLDQAELMDFLGSHYTYITKQVTDIECRLVIGDSRDGITATTRYIPPYQGFFHIVIHNSRHRALKRRALTPGQVDRLVKFANQSSDATKMLVLGVQSTELNLNEAMSMYDNLVHSLGNAVSSLSVLLPNMANDLDSRKMIDIYISDHVTLSRLLRHQLGTSYRPIVGNYTGYYCLDLKKDRDRSCFQKLLERSNFAYYSRKEKDLGDISQNGDRSCFRNGLFNNEPHSIDGTNYSLIPESGKLEFDFVDTVREDYLAMDAITDKRVVELLSQMRLLPHSKLEWANERLIELRIGMENVMKKIGSRYWECHMTRAIEVGDYIRKVFYPNLVKRRQQFSEALAREKKLVALVREDDDESVNSSTMMSHDVPAQKRLPMKSSTHTMKLVKSPLKPPTKVVQTPEKRSSLGVSSGEPTSSRSQAIKENLMRLRTEKFYRSMARYTNDLNAPNPGIAANFVAFLEELFGTSYLRCRHVVLILELFVGGRMKKTDYGSYHTEIVVTLFQHIKDLHNFELIFSVISAEDQANVLGRLGFLTLFNPIKAEGHVRLHLSSYEQRQIAKILMHLSLDEPAENWVGETYSSSPDLPPMPGWQLSVVWFTEEGLPKFGVLSTRYYSGEGVEGDGFAPNAALRNALLSLVLIHPNDIRSEDNESYLVVKPSVTLTDCQALLKKTGEVSWTYDPAGKAAIRGPPARATKR